MGSKSGAMKAAATKASCTIEEYNQRAASGEKWCCACKDWHQLSAFGLDVSRSDGLSSCCLASKRVKVPKVRTKFKRHGWLTATRDGDKSQARHRINYLVAQGRIPDPDDLPCVDCGDTGESGLRHEYDHHLGYSAEHQLDVEAVCSACHARRDRPVPTHCPHGHEYTPENTILRSNGKHRVCRACTRARDRERRDAAHWRAYRARRRNGRSDQSGVG